MSFNGFRNSNNYSPYYQQMQGQDGRGQYQDQARNSAPYQSNEYQPLSAFQSNQQQQASAPQSTPVSAYASQGYGTARSQDPRGAYSSSGRSVDTSALGSLAYASSLGRDSSAGHNTSGYNNTDSHMNFAGPGQYDSGRTNNSGPTDVSSEVVNARPQQATPLPPHGYSSGGYAGYNGHQAYSGAQAQGYAHETTSQAPRPSAKSQNPSGIVRPASGQATHDTHSRMGSQAPYAAITRANQGASSMAQSQSAEINKSEQSRVQSPLQPVNPTSGMATGPPFKKLQTRQVAYGSTGKASGKANAQVSPSTASFNRSGPAKDAHQSSTGDSQVGGNDSRTSTPVGNQFPTTVDPSQVFNHYEYSRRQAAAAEAEASRNKATEGAQVATPMKDTATSHAQSGSSQQIPSRQQNGTASSNEGQSSNVDPDTAKKMQMELEMKQMIEKMRDYKSKDPSLFTQIWEQVKKSQPAPRAPSQPAAQDTSVSPVVVNDQIRSPSTAQSHLPPESELPAAQPKESEDRGRFPAQRRRRGGKNYTPPKGSTAPQDGSTPPTSSSNPAGLSVQAPATQNLLQNAMEDHHANSNSQKPPAGQPAPSAAGAQSLQQKLLSSTPTPAAKIPKQQPQQSKTGETYWPEDKKRTLAEAANKTLTTDPQNAGKQITTAEIHELLDQNPSYMQMCEILEYRGFVINRSQFARTLLSAVPDLGAATAPDARTKKPPTGPPPVSAGHPSAQGRVPQPLPYYAPPVPPIYHTLCPNPNVGAPPRTRDYRLIDRDFWTLEERHQHQNAMGWSRPYDNNHIGMSLPNGSQPADAQIAYSSSADVNTGSPFTAPATGKVDGVKWADKHDFIPNSLGKVVDERSQINGAHALSKDSVNASHVPTKQDLARKRSFGDIVDLTQLSDDERPPQRPRLDDDNSSLPHTVNGHNQVYFPQHGMMRSSIVKSAPEQAVSTPSTKGSQSSLKRVKTKPSSRQYLWSEPDIIRPMNKRQDALRRSSYDPKTIARDILLAVGKHPTMAPLNSHLDILREKFTAVNNDSDLSTFRWDLVDPGDPAPAETKDANDADDKEPHTPSSRSLLSRHRPRISVVVGVDNGGGGGTNAPVESPVTTPARNATARRPRGRPSRGGHAFSHGRSRPHDSEPLAQHRGASDQEQETTNQPKETQDQHQASHPGRVTSQSKNNRDLSRFIYTDPSPTPRSNTATTPGSDAAPKKRGRPSGAKNKNPRSDKGVPKKEALDHTPSSTHVPVPARPRLNGTVTTPVKPSGLRHALSPTDGVAVVIHSRSPSVANTPQTGSAKGGGPQKTPVPRGRHMSQPSFKIYRCLWEQCPAELHNLETLKKHVRKHRDKSEAGLFPCLWANCYDGNASVASGSQANSKRQHLKFDSDTAWQLHMEGKHLNAVAWELGNGPATHSSGECNQNLASL